MTMLLTTDAILGRIQNHFEEYGLNSSVVEKNLILNWIISMRIYLELRMGLVV
jgi:hypothetical protein